MNTAGIVAEYNPFHNGHKYHIEETMRITGCDDIIVVISGNFVQRGEPAIVDKWTRTRCALLNGASIVIELPVLFSTAGAQYFAHSAVKLLNDTGIVDFLSFGSEIGDVSALNETAKMLVAAGYDALNADVGSYDSWYWSHPPMYQEKGLYLPYNEILKKVVDVPIISAGRMENPELASEAIISGKTDMIGLARPLLADADIPNKILAGKFESVRPCLSCQEGCMGRLQTYATVSCAVNPACCREKEYGIEKSNISKNVLVVGGGVAGLEAARVLSLRGHKTTLIEKNAYIGGNIVPGGVPSFKEDDKALVKWYELTLGELGVAIRLNETVTKESMKEFGADEVIIATGSNPRLLGIEGAENVYCAEDVLMGRKTVGDKILMIGGGLVGCETALWLKEQGKEVTIVEMQNDILQVGGPLCHANHDMLTDLIKFNKIEVKTDSYISKKTDEGFMLNTKGQESAIMADDAIVAIGYSSQKSLYNEIKFDIPNTHIIGDANKVQNIMYAIWNAYEVARNI